MSLGVVAILCFCYPFITLVLVDLEPPKKLCKGSVAEFTETLVLRLVPEYPIRSNTNICEEEESTHWSESGLLACERSTDAQLLEYKAGWMWELGAYICSNLPFDDDLLLSTTLSSLPAFQAELPNSIASATILYSLLRRPLIAVDQAVDQLRGSPWTLPAALARHCTPSEDHRQLFVYQCIARSGLYRMREGC